MIQGVEREIGKHMLRALWSLQNNVIKGKNLCVRNMFSFYNFQCPSETVKSELTINITLGRNQLTKYVCCSTWHARAHMIPPGIKTYFCEKWQETAHAAPWVWIGWSSFLFQRSGNLQVFDLTLTEERKLSWRAFYWWYAEICYPPRIACIRVP